MRYRHNDDHSIIYAIQRAVRKTVQQTAANSWLDLLVERRDQTHRPIELVQEPVAQPDNLGLVPRKRLVKRLLRRREERDLQGLRYLAITVS